jgi:hypothetical protein
MKRVARGIAVWRWTLSCCVVACSSDAVCVVMCAPPKAAEISVTATNAPTGIAGLTMTITGPVVPSSVCQGPRCSTDCSPNFGCTGCSQVPQPKDICAIYGEPGSYQVTLNAPGYQLYVLSFTAASFDAGCCAGQAVTQTPSVVMQPAAD